jgi:hypothetical protein
VKDTVSNRHTDENQSRQVTQSSKHFLISLCLLLYIYRSESQEKSTLNKKVFRNNPNRRKPLWYKDLGERPQPRRPKSLRRKDLRQSQISLITFPFFSSRRQQRTGVPPHPSG